MTEELKHFPLSADTITALFTGSALLPARVAAALDRYSQLRAQIAALEELGITNATPYYRDNKYLYLIHPTAGDGSREREYIGADANRQAEALARLERFKQHQHLVQQANTQRSQLERAANEIRALVFSLGA